MKMRKRRLAPKNVVRLKVLDLLKFKVTFSESGRCLDGQPYFSINLKVKK